MPKGIFPRPDPLDLFLQKVVFTEDCWLWTSTRNRSGYGMVTIHNKSRTAHRVAYEWFVGPVPDGLVIDHLCRVRHCVNPDHMEPVTSGENTRRGITGWNMRIKTHCPQGHPYEGDNVYRWRGRRFCWTCLRTRAAQRRAK